MYSPSQPSPRNSTSQLASVLLLVSIPIFWSVSTAHAQMRDASEVARQELAQAASVAGLPLIQNPQTPSPDFNDQWDRLSSIYRYRNWDISTPALARAWFDVQQNTKKCLLLLTEIAEIDHQKPTGIDIFVAMLKDAGKDQQSQSQQNQSQQSQSSETGEAILRRLIAEGGKLVIESQFRDAETNLNNSIAALQSAVASGSRYESSNKIAIDFLPAWQGAFSNEMLEARNVSGADITHAAAVVTIHEADGSSKTHLHYIDSWPNGSLMRARYPYYQTDYLSGQASEHPASVDVAVYVPWGTVTSSYSLTPDEWSKKLEGYCDRLKFTGNLLGPYVEDVSNRRIAPGFQFSFSGLGKLPVKSVTLRFWPDDSPDDAQSVIWRGADVLESNKTYSYRSEIFEQGDGVLSRGQNPAHVDVILELSDGTYQKVNRFY